MQWTLGLLDLPQWLQFRGNWWCGDWSWLGGQLHHGISRNHASIHGGRDICWYVMFVLIWRLAIGLHQGYDTNVDRNRRIGDLTDLYYNQYCWNVQHTLEAYMSIPGDKVVCRWFVLDRWCLDWNDNQELVFDDWNDGGGKDNKRYWLTQSVRTSTKQRPKAFVSLRFWYVCWIQSCFVMLLDDWWIRSSMRWWMDWSHWKHPKTYHSYQER